MYCGGAIAIIDTDTLHETLKKIVANHGIYAKCYDMQRGLVDAVKRRDK